MREGMRAWWRPGRRRPLSAVALTAGLTVGLLAGCGGEPTGPGGGGQGPSGPIGTGRLEVAPSAVLLTGKGASQQLTARMIDASGNATPVSATWRTSASATVSVKADGTVTAESGLGSAQVVAEAGGVTSAPVLVVIARPVTGAVLIADSQVVGEPEAVDPPAGYGVGWRYRVTLTKVAAPPAGTILIASGGAEVAGRVVSSQPSGSGVVVTLEVVRVTDLFPRVQIDESIPLDQAPFTVPASVRQSYQVVPLPGGRLSLNPRAPGEAWLPRNRLALAESPTKFQLGPFECEATGSAPSLKPPKPTIEVKPGITLKLRLVNGAIEELSVQGKVHAGFDYEPVFQATFQGEVTCDAVFKTIILPIGGWLSFVAGGQVPVGVGMTLDGKLAVADVGFKASATADATAELGFRCPGGGSCSALTDFQTKSEGKFEPVLPDPSQQFRLELGAFAYGFAKLELGLTFTKKAGKFEAFVGKGGLKQSLNLATATGQAADPAYASGFQLDLKATAEAGEDLQKAVKWLGGIAGLGQNLTIAPLEYEKELGRSPHGTFTITPASVAPGDSQALGELATFKVTLDPVVYPTDFLKLDAVDEVEIMWDKGAGTGTLDLEPARPGCTDLKASSGQTVFTCQTDFPVEDIGQQVFYAFVHPKLFGLPLPVPLEVDTLAMASVTVGGGKVDCGPAPGTADLLAYTDSVVNFGGTWSTTVVANDYGDVAVSASITAPDTTLFESDFRLVGSLAEDNVFVKPGDPSRVGENVTLKAHVTGHVEVTGSPPRFMVDQTEANGEIAFVALYGGAFNSIPYRDTLLNVGVHDLDQVVDFPVRLGEWEGLAVQAQAKVQADSGRSMASAAGIQLVGLGDVLDSQGQVVPIAGICTESGKTF